MKRTRVFAMAAIMTVSAQTADAQDWESWFQDTAAQRVGVSILEIQGDSQNAINLGFVAADSDHEPDANTPFEIGSISKVFTNLLLAELVAKDVVRYETTLGELLPDVQFANPEVATITLEQLATHRSGLPRLPSNMQPANPADPYADYTPELLLEELATVRKNQSLVHQYAYSNLGVGLLGYVLGSADGSDFGGALREHVLKPLGITATLGCMEGSAIGHAGRTAVPYWQLDALAGAGALCMSANELGKLLKQYTAGRKSALAHDQAWDREIVADAGPYEVTRVWHVTSAGDSEVFWHNGGTGGFRSFAGFNPDTNEALVILSNTDADVTTVGIEKLLGRSAEDLQSEEPDQGGQYDDYIGHFLLNPGFSISIFEKSGQLYGQATGQPPLTLGESGEDRFNVMEVDASIAFNRDESGDVSSLVLHQNGVAQSAPRVDEPVKPKAFEAIDLPEDTLNEYVGEYQLGPGFLFTIRLENGQLTAQLTGQGPAPIFPYAKDEFFYRIVDAQLTFTRDDDGKVGGLILHQNGMDQPAGKLEQ